MSFCRICQGEHRKHASRGVAAPMPIPAVLSPSLAASSVPPNVVALRPVAKPLTEAQAAYFAKRLTEAGFTIVASAPLTPKASKSAKKASKAA